MNALNALYHCLYVSTHIYVCIYLCVHMHTHKYIHIWGAAISQHVRTNKYETQEQTLVLRPPVHTYTPVFTQTETKTPGSVIRERKRGAGTALSPVRLTLRRSPARPPSTPAVPAAEPAAVCSGQPAAAARGRRTGTRRRGAALALCKCPR